MTTLLRRDRPMLTDSPRLSRLGATPTPVRLRPRRYVSRPRRPTLRTHWERATAQALRRREAVGPNRLRVRTPWELT